MNFHKTFIDTYTQMINQFYVTSFHSSIYRIQHQYIKFQLNNSTCKKRYNKHKLINQHYKHLQIGTYVILFVSFSIKYIHIKDTSYIICLTSFESLYYSVSKQTDRHINVFKTDQFMLLCKMVIFGFYTLFTILNLILWCQKCCSIFITQYIHRRYTFV